MEPLLIIGFFCFGPLALVVFGYWLGKGAPGWPWALVRREQPQGGGVYRPAYYDREEFNA